MFKLLSIVSVIGCISAFHIPHVSVPRSKLDVSMKFEAGKVFNAKAVTGLLAFLSSVSLTISPVNAANYGGFGSKYSAVIDPKEAVLNSETASSDDVKSGLEGLKGLISTVKAISDDLAKDSQMDAYTRVKADLPIGAIRTTLNKFNSAFSEETQLGTDRLIRNVVQDITELQRESQVKPGKARADTKVNALKKRLLATQSSLEDLAKFYPK
eukprot:gene5860-11834_t